MAPILERLRLDAIQWCRLVEDFGRIFKRAAGRGETPRQTLAVCESESAELTASRVMLEK
jgi:hypothetical protein